MISWYVDDYGDLIYDDDGIPWYIGSDGFSIDSEFGEDDTFFYGGDDD